MSTNFHLSELLGAVRSADPWPVYDRHRPQTPVARGPESGVWYTLDPEAIRSILVSRQARVRPPAEPVPATLAGTEVCSVFSHLIRMRDGTDRIPIWGIIEGLLRSIEPGSISESAARALSDLDIRADRAALTAALPDRVMEILLGIDPLPAGTIEAFVRGVAPSLAETDSEAAEKAAGILNQAVGAAAINARGPVALALAEAGVEGLDREAMVANLIGLLFQNHDATAGLLGSVVTWLGNHPEVRSEIIGDRGALRGLVEMLARTETPVHLTRRWLAADLTVSGTMIPAGSEIILFLAAANRAEPASDLGFGHGPHACPGREIALQIVVAVVDLLLDDPNWAWADGPPSIRSLRTTRVPEFAAGAARA